MKDKLHIAIHHRPGSFSDRWLEYCQVNKIPHLIVDCLKNDILNQLDPVSALLWHFTHGKYIETIMAREIITAVEKKGIKTFPDINTCWHFDNKIAQKYLLEAINAPLVPSHVFYQKETVMEWLGKTNYPKIFKLKNGAGSSNVRLVKNKGEAIKLCQQAFGRGFISHRGYFGDTQTKIRKTKSLPDLFAKLKRFPKYFINAAMAKRDTPRERGYVYFQDFMPGNQYDTRITIIGNRAFGFTRDVRPNDFRASGSGSISYDLKRVDMQCVGIAFEVAEKIRSQSMAFDFIKDENGKPKIVEISYGFNSKAVYDCAGYWDRKLKWHEGYVYPEDAIIEDLLNPRQ